MGCGPSADTQNKDANKTQAPIEEKSGKPEKDPSESSPNHAKSIINPKQNIKDAYDFTKELGKGAYASVFKAVDKQTKEARAVKEAKTQFTNEAALLKEAEILMALVFFGVRKYRIIQTLLNAMTFIRARIIFIL